MLGIIRKFADNRIIREASQFAQNRALFGVSPNSQIIRLGENCGMSLDHSRTDGRVGYTLYFSKISNNTIGIINECLKGYIKFSSEIRFTELQLDFSKLTIDSKTDSENLKTFLANIIQLHKKNRENRSTGNCGVSISQLIIFIQKLKTSGADVKVKLSDFYQIDDNLIDLIYNPQEATEEHLVQFISSIQILENIDHNFEFGRIICIFALDIADPVIDKVKIICNSFVIKNHVILEAVVKSVLGYNPIQKGDNKETLFIILKSIFASCCKANIDFIAECLKDRNISLFVAGKLCCEFQGYVDLLPDTMYKFRSNPSAHEVGEFFCGYIRITILSEAIQFVRGWKPDASASEVGEFFHVWKPDASAGLVGRLLIRLIPNASLREAREFFREWKPNASVREAGEFLHGWRTNASASEAI